MESLAESQFYRLKILSFSKNFVESLNFISKMSLRKLQGLLAHNNKISELDPLARSILPLLK